MAALGFLNPLLAAFIHVTSELAFILNSTRLLPRSSKIGQYVRGLCCDELRVAGQGDQNQSTTRAFISTDPAD